MSKYQSQNNLGEQFRKAVSDALANGDFTRLNTLVTDTVTDAISEAGRQVKNAAENATKNDSKNYSKIYENTRAYQERQRQRNASYYRNTTSNQQSSQPKPTLPAVKTRNVGQVSSILYTVFGGIGTGISSSVLLGGAICAALGFIWPVPVFLLLGGLIGGSLLMLRKGITERKRLSRMKRYISLCADKMYVNISDLAKQANQSTKYILKDIKKMLKLGFFPEGHLDENETCLMLDDATYREYLRVEKQRQAYLADQHAKNSGSNHTTTAQDKTPHGTSSTSDAENFDASQTNSSKATAKSTGNAELDAMIREGQDYIRKLHELNDLIPGEVISEKMYRMEDLLKEIFDRLEEDPTQMPKLHKLMNYYLPTTIKLLQAYSEFDDVTSPGADIVAAKAEIEKTVDTINEAFTELLNKLFQATVFDVTTDAQVLQTMLAKEGLTKNDFSEDKK